MAITASQLMIIVRGTMQGQRWENVQWYRPTGSAFLTADAVSVAEAYWNDVKTVWRAATTVSPALTFDSVFVSEPGSTGAFGEFAVPPAESQGSRSGSGLGEFLPAFCAAAVRLTVATRATRPGQKRFVGGTEGDNLGGVWSAAYIALIDALAAKFDSTITLGVPVATGVLDPIVVRINRATGAIVTDQLVVGHLTNPNISSQVSRKIGRGI